MELLVSVRSADEVEPALAGGADIIDAKEPTRGSLGAVSGPVLCQILARTPVGLAVSVALGDMIEREQVTASLADLQLPRRRGPIYLKLGFAGVDSTDEIATLIGTAVRAAAEMPARPQVVAVAYADHDRAGTVPPASICRLAAQVRASGILLDTHTKDGQGLLRWLDPLELAIWVSDARRSGLLTALAGSLQLADMESVRLTAPDIVAVRGAACDGGRNGLVSLNRVLELRRGIDAGGSGSAHRLISPGCLSEGSRNA